MDITLSHADIRRALESAYGECRTVSGGKNADYIPYLSNINPDLFGISITLLDGTTFKIGDTDFRFGIESKYSRLFSCWTAGDRRRFSPV